MPSVIEDAPLSLVNQAFHDKTKQWPASVQDFFNEKLAEINVDLVTSINETPRGVALIDGQLVKFRGMVQDMHDPEIFMDQFGVKNLSTGETRLETCRYRDATNLGPKEEHDESVKVLHGERLSFYCVSIPGESPWVKDAFSKKYPVHCTPSTSDFGGRPKRGREEEEDEEEVMDECVAEKMENQMDTSSQQPTEQKKSKSDKEEAPKVAKAPSMRDPLNFPIPKSQGHGVIVKLYDVEEGTLKLNDCVEFIGIVSLDPLLAAQNGTKNVDEFMQPEIEAKNPPPSLIPRLHVLKFQKLVHNNPYLVQNPTATVCWEEIRRCRDELHALLTHLLLGDSVAAEYMICHLMSQIYTRKDGLCLGKSSLNLFSVPNACYAKRFFTILQLLLTKSHHLPLSIENLNNYNFVPKKDYNVNRLESAILQLSSGTHLLLDETVMNNGQLNPEGVKNITALGQVIKFQALPYDFGYHNLSFDTDIPCLVLSEGRSILPFDFQLFLKPQVEVNQAKLDDIFSQAGKSLDIEQLNRLRNYVTTAKSMNFELSEEAQNFVQEDFVQQRQNPSADIKTSDDLHSLLVLARLICLSRGEKSLNPSIWNEAKSLEKERKQRSAHLPTRAQQM